MNINDDDDEDGLFDKNGSETIFVGPARIAISDTLALAQGINCVAAVTSLKNPAVASATGYGCIAAAIGSDTGAGVTAITARDESVAVVWGWNSHAIAANSYSVAVAIRADSLATALAKSSVAVGDRAETGPKGVAVGNEMVRGGLGAVLVLMNSKGAYSANVDDVNIMSDTWYMLSDECVFTEVKAKDVYYD